MPEANDENQITEGDADHHIGAAWVKIETENLSLSDDGWAITAFFVDFDEKGLNNSTESIDTTVNKSAGEWCQNKFRIREPSLQVDCTSLEPVRTTIKGREEE